MKRNDILKMLLALLMVITVLIFLLKTVENKNKKLVINKEYILKASNGVVVLYLGEEIIETYDVELEALPFSDRQLLEQGIKYKNINDVYSAIEDYDG